MKIHDIHHNNQLNSKVDSIHRYLMLIDQIVIDLKLVTKIENILIILLDYKNQLD